MNKGLRTPSHSRKGSKPQTKLIAAAVAATLGIFSNVATAEVWTGLHYADGKIEASVNEDFDVTDFATKFPDSSISAVGLIYFQPRDEHTNQTIENADWSLNLTNTTDASISEDLCASVVFMGFDSTLKLTGDTTSIAISGDQQFDTPDDGDLIGVATGFASHDLGQTRENRAVIEFAADQTNINVSTTSDAAPSIAGIKAEAFSKVLLSNGTLSITTQSAGNTVPAEADTGADNDGMYLSGQALFETAAETKVDIHAISTGNGTVDDPYHEFAPGENAGSYAIGVTTEGGSILANGDFSVEAESNGGFAAGLVLQGVAGDSGWNSLYQDEISNWGAENTFNGNLTISAESQTGRAEGVRIGGFVPYDPDEDDFAPYGDYSESSRVVMTTAAGTTTTITATDHSDAVRSVGVYFALPEGKQVGDEEWNYNLGELHFNGTTTVTADDALAGEAGYLYNAGTLTLNGDVDQFKGEFTQTAGQTTLNTTNGKFFGGKVALNAGDLVVNGDIEFSTAITGNGNLIINGEGGSVSFTGANDNKIGNLTVSNADFTNTSNIDVTGTITLNNVKIDNLDDGDVEAKDAIYLGAGTVLRNYGHFDADNWVLLEGSKYLEAYDEGDPDFSNGNMVHDSGRVEFAGGLYGLVSDENALKSWTVTTDREEAAEWGDDYTQPQLVISASEYDWDYVTVDSTATETNALEVTGGALKLGAFNAQLGRAAVTGGEFHADTLNSSGAFTMNVGEKGTFTVGKFVGAEGGAFTLASGTMQADALDLTNGLLTIADGANLSTLSGQIFNPGLNEEGDNPDAGKLLWGEDNLVFAEGSTLTIRDEYYNDQYASSAGALLDGVNIVFRGTAVDASGEAVIEKPLEDMTEGHTQATVTITAEADDTGTVTVNSTVGGKNLVVDENTKTVAVTADKTLTLVGSKDGGELVDFQTTEEGTSIDVNGGLALGVTGADAEATKGTITSTVELATGSNLKATNGEFTLSKVNANGANIEVASGTLAVTDLTLSGETTVAAAAGATTNFKNVAANEGTHQIKGDITAETVTGEGMLLVGSAEEDASASATLAVKTLDHTGVIFIDPAWVDGQGIEDGSFFTVDNLGDTNELKAHVVAGQNSTFVFGTTKEAAVEAFGKTGLAYGEKDITAVLYVAKPINVTTGSITVDGTLADRGDFDLTDKAGSVTIAGNGLAMIDAAALTTEGTAAITASTIDLQKGAEVRIANLKGNLSDAVLFEATEENGLSMDENITFESNDAMVNIVLDKDGNKVVYSTETNEADDVFTGFEGNNMMQAIYEAGANNTASTDRTVAFLSNMAAYQDKGLSLGQAVDMGNQAMALAATSGVYNVALDASKLMNKSVDGRMSIANGLVRGEGATVWADVLATTNEAKSLYGDSGYDVDLYGGVLGADVGLGNGKVIGAALTVGTGDGGSKGAAFDVDNDADFVGFSVYGSHRLGDFNGKVDIGWMHTTSDLSATAFGVKLDDEVTADVWTVGIGGEYLFNVGSINIVPHVGIRWTRLDVDGYTGAFKTDDDTMDIFTAPIGVAISGNIDAGGWKLAPKVDLSIVPSFGDDDATSKVRWGNVKETIKTQVVDDAPFQASLGIDAQNGDWTVGAAYELGIGGDERLDNFFSLRARYAF